MKATKPGSIPRQEIPADPGHEDLSSARRAAIRISGKNRGWWYIIEAGDRFFVQDTCVLQGWDIHHETYYGGKIV